MWIGQRWDQKSPDTPGSPEGNPECPSPSAGDLRDLARVPLRGEGSCGGGGRPLLLWSVGSRVHGPLELHRFALQGGTGDFP